MYVPLGKVIEVKMDVIEDIEGKELTMWSVALVSMIQEGDEEVNKHKGLPKSLLMEGVKLHVMMLFDISYIDVDLRRLNSFRNTLWWKEE